MFTTIIISLLRSILMIVGILIAMVIISPTLSIYIGLITPLVAVSAFVFRKFSRAAYREVRHNVSNVNAFLSENLSGMKITQVCNQEDKKLKEFQEKNTALRKSSERNLCFAIFRPFIYVLTWPPSWSSYGSEPKTILLKDW
jgi:ATP-binding cassette subfamily B protein